MADLVCGSDEGLVHLQRRSVVVTSDEYEHIGGGFAGAVADGRGKVE